MTTSITKAGRTLTIQDYAKQIRCPLFADRRTLKEALDYATEIAKACGPRNQMAVMTAVYVVLNTVANDIEKLEAAPTP